MLKQLKEVVPQNLILFVPDFDEKRTNLVVAELECGGNQAVDAFVDYYTALRKATQLNENNIYNNVVGFKVVSTKKLIPID
jgi:hypothetical protein